MSMTPRLCRNVLVMLTLAATAWAFPPAPQGIQSCLRHCRSFYMLCVASCGGASCDRCAADLAECDAACRRCGGRSCD